VVLAVFGSLLGGDGSVIWHTVEASNHITIKEYAMTTQTLTSSTLTSTDTITSQRESLLRRVLYGNVIFSVISGGLFIIASEQIASFIGIGDNMVFNLINGASLISIIGIGIALFALDVLFVATHKPINVKYAGMIAIADFIWVGLSWLLLATGVIPFSDAGNWGVLIISDIVLMFAIAEVVGIRRIKR